MNTTTTLTTTQPIALLPAGSRQPATALITSFAPISLKEMAGVALLNRTDTKYVLSTATLWEALQGLRGAYRMLEVEGVRLNHYRTVYFDTADFALYQRHHAGAADRYKVRARLYQDSGLAFLEVKHKTNKKRTIKERLRTDKLQSKLTLATVPFLQRYYPGEAAALLPVLVNFFTRITLVGNDRPERITLDFDLGFSWGDRHETLPGLAIAELKQEGYALRSRFSRQMHTLGVRPASFSKYCLGASLLYPWLKQNNFKRTHLLVQKIMRGTNHDNAN
jgi:hypothetical protein